MDADYSVELGAEDPTLDFPWEAPGTSLRFYSLKDHPEQLELIEEAQKYPPLYAFLKALNSDLSFFETAKCDVWVGNELSESEDIYDGRLKYASYVDLVCSGVQKPLRTDFRTHETFCSRAVDLLNRAPLENVAVEFIVRRCYFRDKAEPESGFYITLYLSAYGDDEDQALKRWGIALNVVQHALLQVSARFNPAQ